MRRKSVTKENISLVIMSDRAGVFSALKDRDLFNKAYPLSP
jgi:hypothetical protein